MNKTGAGRRYEMLGKIGTGDFATTYAAKDLKLNRKVAIKRLHEQYAQDEQKLARYWDEAQLLASLEHPNNMTIYDVGRAKGYLVLELMQGSLRQIYGKKPMPVQDVKQTLIQALQGLQCLHENGIVHGDVNPNNLFLSRQDVVKLGDFGLARRVDDDQGSMIKGTTRYIAPEMVSEEFGKVGSPSDLYSLGFSALDLLVGPQFESLFPDLVAFGRDRKMAWMMWHCSKDRRFPPISSILDGVPIELSKVLDKLTAKDQTVRYQSAKQALADLQADPAPVGKSLKDERAAAEALARLQKSKRRKRNLMLLAASALLGLTVWWFTRPAPEIVERQAPPPVIGVVKNVLPFEEKLVLDVGADWKEFKLRQGDKVVLNRAERQLRDLEEGDRVAVHTRLIPENKSYFEIQAFRPTSHTGILESVDTETSRVVMRVTEGVEADKQFDLLLPTEVEIILNKMDKDPQGAVLTINSLAVGDRVIIENCDDEQGMLALAVEAYRQTETEGIVRDIQLQSRLITINLNQENGDESFVKLPINTDCQYSLNGLDSLNEQLIELADLQPGDRVTVTHDSTANRIEAWREYTSGGAISSLDFESKQLTIGDVTFTVDDNSVVKLGNERVTFDDLRAGDQLEIQHDSPGEAIPVVDSLVARRPADSRKWALMIAYDSFTDQSIAGIPNALTNTAVLRSSLVNRYAVPENQAMVFENVDRVRMEQEIPTWLAQIPDDAELYVYLCTRAQAVPEASVFLATNNTQWNEIEDSGLPLIWLVDQLDAIKTGHKVLFMDCTHPNQEPQNQVGTKAMIDQLKATRRGGFPKSLYVFGSGPMDQSADNGFELFSETLAAGFAGQADEVRDNRLAVTELTDFVSAALAKTELVLPDPSPARIPLNAKQAILELLAQYGTRRLDRAKVLGMAAEANRLCPGQPEPDLALGAVLLKATKIDDAYEFFETVRLKNPQYLVAHRCVTWIHFHKLRYDDGLKGLTDLLKQIPRPEDMDGQSYSAEVLEIFNWAGQLRTIAELADWSQRMPSAASLEAYDLLLAEFGEQPLEFHKQGESQAQAVIDEFADPQLNPTSLPDFKKARLTNFVDRIADENLVSEIEAWLDRK